jgi:4-amino-4-deoxy-L-arabinose transferase-like glycosyltransferase
VLAFFVRVMISNIRPFQSDESIYVYASYAVTRGVVPYRQIFFAHPPLMYVTYCAFIRLVGPDFVRIRLLNVIVFLSTVFLTYVMARMILKSQNGNRTYALLSAAVYAFYPSYFLLISTTSLLENMLTLLTIGAVVSYLAFRNSRSKWLLFFAGVLMGLALITTLRAVLFVLPMLLFHVFACFWRRKYKAAFTDIAYALSGVLIPVLLVVVWAAIYWQALPQLYLQIIYRQMIRPYQEGRLLDINWYIDSIFPLIVMGVLGAIYSARIAKVKRESSFVLPIFIFGVSFVALLFAFSNTFFHYFFYLNPYLAFLSVVCFLQVKSILATNGSSVARIKLDRNLTLLSIFVVLLFLLSFQAIGNFRETEMPYFRQTAYNSLHFYVGSSVAMITEPSDRIWTSECAISFFSQRLIVAPNSSSWPVQGFFSSWFDFSSYDSQERHEISLLDTAQFVEAWEREKVKVIVFILGKGWVPYPDELLWNGFQEKEGVASYVQEEYEMQLMVASPDVPYVYYVWVRK